MLRCQKADEEQKEAIEKNDFVASTLGGKDREWIQKTQQQIFGMEAALGLSDGDIDDIRRVIEEDISTQAV